MLTRPRLRLAALFLVPALALAATACSSSGSSSKAGGSSTSGGSSGSTITIKDFKFSPAPLTVKVGQKVTVKNADSTTHTVTANDGSFNTGDVNAGSSASFTAKKAGTFKFHCNIHNYMTGTLKVTS
jgi:plastocyanin